MATGTILDAQLELPAPDQKIDFDYELTQGFAAGYIRRQAKKLAHRFEHTCRERACVDDLAQQLTLHLLERLPQFDPSQGRFDAFATLVVKHSVVDIQRHAQAQKRGEMKTQSLDALPASTTSSGNTQAICQGTKSRHLGVAKRSECESSDLAADVASVIEGLPRRLRRIAQLLGQHSATSVRRKLHLSRKKLDRALSELQQRFSAAELQEYLQISDTP